MYGIPCEIPKTDTTPVFILDIDFPKIYIVSDPRCNVCNIKHDVKNIV